MPLYTIIFLLTNGLEVIINRLSIKSLDTRPANQCRCVRMSSVDSRCPFTARSPFEFRVDSQVWQ